MTLVVGANLGYYTLLAADSRITYYEEGKAERVDDFAKKVFETPVGLASGSGLTPIVFGVIHSLSEQSDVLADPDERTQFIKDFNGPAGFWSTARLPENEQVQRAAQRVGSIFTSVERGSVHTRFYQSDFDFNPIDGPDGAPLVLLPIDARPEQSEPHERQLMARLRKARSAKDFNATLDHNLTAFVRFFKELGRISRVLGPGIQVGFQTRAGDVELGEVMMLAGFPD